MFSLEKELHSLSSWSGPRISGRVLKISSLIIESTGPRVCVGELCLIRGQKGKPLPAQVIGFEGSKVLLMAFGPLDQIAPGSEVYPTFTHPSVRVSNELKGRIINALGHPLDEKEVIKKGALCSIYRTPPSPLKRPRIQHVLPTGIKAIDAFLTLGRGQRIGIFSKPGAGKSTLLGMLSRLAEVDVIVIALIGERGREVRDFLEKELGEEGRKKAVTVVSTADEPPPLRVFGAYSAMTIAEFFRDQGQNVLLLVDSLSRFAWAQREVSLAAGELPSNRGYPPSVFTQLPRLLERGGMSEKGSITSLFTVLCEEDEIKDPFVDHARSLLDGHFFLSEKLAEGAHFPALDILKSLSRLMSEVAAASHVKKAAYIRKLLRAYEENHELIHLGAYVKGTNPLIDEALEKYSSIQTFLQQKPSEKISWEETLKKLEKLVL